ncbi:hypothetical protein N7466_009752 [Penicillium verhagenii]|uniref:uncharacterized protein n=1 Tax=Penicillium verhagenii TaxID=1562060 RepID=UPI0025452761|nr:uncharacterized protein N7466_009752 [Penicillium verhagenii]KAJ5921426.1 hypothetical protein N7466_009752 [Penicillium verhagenii]
MELFSSQYRPSDAISTSAVFHPQLITSRSTTIRSFPIASTKSGIINTSKLSVFISSPDIEVPEVHNRKRVLNDSLKRARKRLKGHGSFDLEFWTAAEEIDRLTLGKTKIHRKISLQGYNGPEDEWKASDEGKSIISMIKGREKKRDICRQRVKQLTISGHGNRIRADILHETLYNDETKIPELFSPRNGLLISTSIDRYMDTGKIVIVPDLPEQSNALEAIKWLTSQSRSPCPLKEEEEEENEDTEYVLGFSLG